MKNPVNTNGRPRPVLRAKLLRFPLVAFVAVSNPGFAESSSDGTAATQPAILEPEEKRVSAWHASEPWRTDGFFLATSVYTHHYNYDPAHNNTQNLILGEWNITEQWLAGAASLHNSFNQPTHYVYGGYRFRPLQNLQPFYLKISAGIIHGYKDEYQDKIPFNSSGYAPVIIPTLGYCLNRVCSELVFFGAAGVMATLGATIP